MMSGLFPNVADQSNARRVLRRHWGGWLFSAGFVVTFAVVLVDLARQNNSNEYAIVAAAYLGVMALAASFLTWLMVRRSKAWAGFALLFLIVLAIILSLIGAADETSPTVGPYLFLRLWMGLSVINGIRAARVLGGSGGGTLSPTDADDIGNPLASPLTPPVTARATPQNPSGTSVISSAVLKRAVWLCGLALVFGLAVAIVGRYAPVLRLAEPEESAADQARRVEAEFRYETAQRAAAATARAKHVAACELSMASAEIPATPEQRRLLGIVSGDLPITPQIQHLRDQYETRDEQRIRAERDRIRREHEHAAEFLYLRSGLDPGRAQIAGRAAVGLGLPPAMLKECQDLTNVE